MPGSNGSVPFLLNARVCGGMLLKVGSSHHSCSSDFFFFFLTPQLHLCVQLTSSAVNQGAASVCPGAVMGKMTAPTTVMRRIVKIQVWSAALLLVANSSILEAMDCKVSFGWLDRVQPQLSVLLKV